MKPAFGTCEVCGGPNAAQLRVARHAMMMVCSECVYSQLGRTAIVAIWRRREEKGETAVAYIESGLSEDQQKAFNEQISKQADALACGRNIEHRLAALIGAVWSDAVACGVTPAMIASIAWKNFQALKSQTQITKSGGGQ